MSVHTQIRRAASLIFADATERWGALVEKLEQLRAEFNDDEVDEILDGAIAMARHALECAQENALPDAVDSYGDWRRDQR